MMKDDRDTDERKPAGAAKGSRADRLKLALRENLKRRKSQARGRGDVASASSDAAADALDDAGGKEPDR